MKQPQYSPMAVENQVAVIYAVNNGIFDDVEVKDVSETEAKLIEFLNKSKRTLLDKLVAGEWDEKIEKELGDACLEFKK